MSNVHPIFKTVMDFYFPTNEPKPPFRKDVFGWFDDPYNETPTHDPTVENGICPICGKGLSRPVKTISFCNPYENTRSYFYRTHKECYESATPEIILDIESIVIDHKH